MEIRKSFIGRVSRRAKKAAELVERVLGEQGCFAHWGLCRACIAWADWAQWVTGQSGNCLVMSSQQLLAGRREGKRLLLFFWIWNRR